MLKKVLADENKQKANTELLIMITPHIIRGRTPGLAIAGLRLESVRGGSLGVDEALIRAAVAVPSAAFGLAGFALALLDPRGQTLHDKLCGTVVVRAQGA